VSDETRPPTGRGASFFGALDHDMEHVRQRVWRRVQEGMELERRRRQGRALWLHLSIATAVAAAAMIFGAASLIWLARPAGAAGPAIAISPASANAAAGSDVTVEITADGVPASPGLGGYSIVVRWDPAVLSLASFDDTGWIEGGDVVVHCDIPTTIDNADGTAKADCSPERANGDGLAATAPQALLRAVFHAEATGTTSIDLSDSYLLTPSAAPVSATLINGVVTIAALSPQTPAATTADMTPAASTTLTANAPAGAATTAPTSGPAANSTDSGSRTAGWIAAFIVAAIVLAGGAAMYQRRRGRREASDENRPGAG
jgi:hypothetical protein